MANCKECVYKEMLAPGETSKRTAHCYMFSERVSGFCGQFKKLVQVVSEVKSVDSH